MLKNSMRQLLSTLRRFVAPMEIVDGYENPELVETIFRKTVAFRPDAAWPDVAGASSVLDFGGGCGIHYKQADSSAVRWAVVETPAMVARARILANDRLQFFTSVAEAAAWLGPVDVMHSNSALQYSPEPAQTLAQLCGLRSKIMIWSRLTLSAGATEREMQSSRLSDNGPGRLHGIKEKTFRCERAKIPESRFLAAHAADYSMTARGPDWFRFALK